MDFIFFQTFKFNSFNPHFFSSVQSISSHYDITFFVFKFIMQCFSSFFFFKHIIHYEVPFSITSLLCSWGSQLENFPHNTISWIIINLFTKLLLKFNFFPKNIFFLTFFYLQFFFSYKTFFSLKLFFFRQNFFFKLCFMQLFRASHSFNSFMQLVLAICSCNSIVQLNRTTFFRSTLYINSFHFI